MKPSAAARLPPTARVLDAYRTIAEVDRPEVWITLRAQADVLADAGAVEQRLAAGECLPLAGLVVAVKDNIDVAGLPTTAGCREFAYQPATTAVAIERLRDAGAVVLGKTNLDQFGCGLAGTRSPYGAVRNSHHPDLVSGGSSSGSAVAVALGIADIGIGTDTAGSVRVPAALNGLVGIKPTLGIIPTHGVVPACASYDAVCVLADDLTLAAAAVAVMAGPDQRDPRGRPWPADVRLSAPDVPRLAIPQAANLAALRPDYRDAFEQSVRLALDTGCSVKPIDISVLLDAALLLYDGAIVAERYMAVGEFLDTAPASADPVVASIITAAREVTGPDFAADLNALTRARADAARLLDGFDALLLPTTTEHPSRSEVSADPVGISRRMGTYTNFCNLLDMAAVTVPVAPTPAGTPFGVTIVVPAFDDQIAADIGARLTGTESGLLIQTGCELAVFGAHRRGQPLHGQLEQLGARFVGQVATTDARRGELFRISEAGLGHFLSALSAPMALTRIELDDGRTVIGVIG
ncbi:allophanate hydrolase [Mycobacterium florentinum]|uniref:Allophanate hydrolase n=1 Tax=Mycobacterium florentinum TaxID=292462 RepID=A0A1X1UFZ2_MYCFL|nr:allophanate hydrolase [Mycobacterium florentinum]MCV7413190.1 allophanate hydrolase [Mycobacterium florentinum]ORV55711.1 allophanate hydrolase [Mycobacterium florentinum]BBX76714.1 allophanate hydrolase [Mycobacterium florentinum]